MREFSEVFSYLCFGNFVFFEPSIDDVERFDIAKKGEDPNDLLECRLMWQSTNIDKVKVLYRSGSIGVGRRGRATCLENGDNTTKGEYAYTRECGEDLDDGTYTNRVVPFARGTDRVDLVRHVDSSYVWYEVLVLKEELCDVAKPCVLFPAKAEGIE